MTGYLEVDYITNFATHETKQSDLRPLSLSKNIKGKKDQNK